ncbi:glycoside hydrolase family 3 protein [Streptosporangiaceae bacterium NEAU-GS5]|nr:glycoside hydrolase family 3 protein [Streptosporangiaceae bacterium NEAU-GS5]
MEGLDLETLETLDLETKARMLAGQDMWSLPAVPEIGLPSLTMSDGPIGVRGRLWTPDDPSIALPSPTALAATWDPALARRAGNLLAQEARRKGAHVLLAPTVNLHRTPLGGRHFECYSEDPLLTGELATGYVIGVQERGVAVTVKHFVANDSETERMTADVRVDERALRELYLLPFEIVVRKARPYGIMAAYNAVNGTFMTEHDPLVNGVLRGEWGFDGFVVSDWMAAHDTVRAAIGGLDVAMPGPLTVYGPALARAVRDGLVPEDVVDTHVRRVLDLAARTLAPAPPADEIDGRALAREIAVRSATLLRNDGVLPLAGSERIALIGAAAARARVMGGGSAQVYPAHIVSPLEGLRAAGLDVRHAKGAEPSTKPAPARFPLTVVCRAEDGRVLGEFPLPDGQVRWVGELPEGITLDELHSAETVATFVPEESGDHRFGVDGVGRFRLQAGEVTLFDGRQDPEGDDIAAAFLFTPESSFTTRLTAGEPVEVRLWHEVGKMPGIPIAFVSYCLTHAAPTPPDDELIEEAVALAAASDVAVVVVSTSNEVESEGFDRVSLRLPGRQNELVARVGAANPRTVVVVNAGSPVEMPWRDDVAAVLLTWFPGQEAGHALADVLAGRAEPGGRLPTTWPVAMADCPVLNTTPSNGVLTYDEGVFIGYRAWARSGIAPAYWFGHGLGYTDWSYEAAALEGSDAALEGGDAVFKGRTVTVRVRNAGDRPGREVVQVYVEPDQPDPHRPERWLAGFAVVSAEPGETAEATVEIPERAFQIWSDGGWVTVPGRYVLHIGRSYANLPLSLDVNK